MTALTSALDALPVPGPVPTRTASWPVGIDATVFATSIHGALLLLHDPTDEAATRFAVVVEATGAEDVRILPAAPQGAASAAYLDGVVKAHVPRCFCDGREGMEFPTPAGPLRLHWTEGGDEGFQVTVRLTAAQIRREGQLPSAVLGQEPIKSALRAAAIPWIPRAASSVQPLYVDLSEGAADAEMNAFGAALVHFGVCVGPSISRIPVAEVHAICQLVAAWGSRAGKAGRLGRLLLDEVASEGGQAAMRVIRVAASCLAQASTGTLDRIKSQAQGLASLVGGTPAAVGAILANEVPGPICSTMAGCARGGAPDTAQASACRALVIQGAHSALAQASPLLRGATQAGGVGAAEGLQGADTHLAGADGAGV